MLNLKNTLLCLLILVCIFAIVFLYDVLFLLICSYAIASSLQPIVIRLSAKLNPTLALALVFSCFLLIIGLIIATLVPLAYKQAELFFNTIPIYKHYIQNYFIPLLTTKIQSIDNSIINKISDLIEQGSSTIFSFSLSILANIWSYTRTTMHVILFIILLPILIFYFLRDKIQINQNLSKITSLLQPNLVIFCQDCASMIFEFLKGQLTVCIIMSCYYTLLLSLLNVDFSIFLGIASGLSIAIPLVGIISALSLTSIITIFNFGVSNYLIYILLIYFIGQIIEGYFITPKIIGDKIGLHPLVMILLLLIFGKLFGIIGMLIAIPTMCIFKILIKYIPNITE